MPLKTGNGQTLRVRLMRPSDMALLVDFFDHLSSDTRRRRFHTNVDGVSREEVWARAEIFANVANDHTGAAVIALHRDQTGDHIVGVARFAPFNFEGGGAVDGQLNSDGETVAELAMVVRDDWQGRGVGKALLRQLVALARAVGVDTLLAIMDVDNVPMVRILRGLHLPHETETRDGETTMRLRLGG